MQGHFFNNDLRQRDKICSSFVQGSTGEPQVAKTLPITLFFLYDTLYDTIQRVRRHSFHRHLFRDLRGVLCLFCHVYQRGSFSTLLALRAKSVFSSGSAIFRLCNVGNDVELRFTLTRGTNRIRRLLQLQLFVPDEQAACEGVLVGSECEIDTP